MAQPVLYDPSIEHPEANEQEVDQQIIDTMHGISETTFNNSGVAIRSVHAKSHGLLHGTLEVLPVSGPLAQGLFGKPGS